MLLVCVMERVPVIFSVIFKVIPEVSVGPFPGLSLVTELVKGCSSWASKGELPADFAAGSLPSAWALRPALFPSAIIALWERERMG